MALGSETSARTCRRGDPYVRVPGGLAADAGDPCQHGPGDITNGQELSEGDYYGTPREESHATKPFDVERVALCLGSCYGPCYYIFSILVTMYVRLARREEREVLAEFGEMYARYAATTPAFFPRLGHRERREA